MKDLRCYKLFHCTVGPMFEIRVLVSAKVLKWDYALSIFRLSVLNISHFGLLSWPWKSLTAIWGNFTGSKLAFNVLYQFFVVVVVVGGGGCRSENKNRRPGLCLAETFPTCLQLLNRKKSLDILYQFLAFRANLTTRMAALISVWLIHFIVTLYKITTKAV